MRESFDALHAEALERLCADCPQRTAPQVFMFNATMTSDQITPAESLPEPARSAVELMKAYRVIATAALREQSGCDGFFICGDCTDFHCGVETDIALDFGFNSGGQLT